MHIIYNAREEGLLIRFSIHISSYVDVYVPVINTLRADFVLRPDVAYFFKEVNIPVPNLTFIDEIDVDLLSKYETTSIYLNNKLAKHLNQY